MNWRNTALRYGMVAAGFHWLVALLVLVMLGVGLYMTGMEPGPQMFRLYFWHKSVGVMILALAALRFAWKMANPKPQPLPTHERWERALAKLTHALLYTCLFLMPLSGWIMSAAKGFPVSVFGWFTLPDVTGGEKPYLSRLAAQIHEYAAWGLIALIVLHVSGAVKHRFIDRDLTLRRMLPWMKMSAAALAFLLLAAPDAAAKAEAPLWVIDAAKSSIAFEGTQMGASFTGRFPSFSGIIRFDPARPEESSAEITIPIAGVKTGSGERDGYILLPEWLDAASFPESKFTATGFEHRGGDDYVARGTLTLRGVTLPVDLPFTLDVAPDAAGRDIATVKGETMLRRLDYGIGAREWKDTKTVGNDITVRIVLTAMRQDQ